MEKTIRVTCDTKLNIPLDELHEIQGELKQMSVEEYLKFSKLIEKRGIWFASHVWKEPLDANGKKAFRWCIVDGTGRRRLFSKMRDDGFVIPPIPCVEIQAASLKEAKEAVLAASSQFHTATKDGLYEFITEAGIEPAALEEFQLHDIDHEEFIEEFFLDAPPSDEKDGGAELERGSFTKFSQECPKCGFSFDSKKDSK